MDPPVLTSEESCISAPRLENSLPQLTPMQTLKKSSPQVIVPKVEDLTTYMESLIMENHLPSCNVPEKIIIALDTARDENYTYFIENGEKISPFNALLSAIEMFMTLKLHQNKNHEFGIVVLKQAKAFWEYGFSSDIDDLITSLKHILECKADETFDLSSLFTVVVSKIGTFGFFQDQSIPPPYVVRLVLLYNRSYTMPTLHMMQNIKDLFGCPYFFFDILAAHEPISDANKCEEIFKCLQSVDIRGFSYFFNVGRDMSALVRSVLKLLGHPLQRPLQSVANYSL